MEHAVMSYPATVPEQRRDYLEHKRDRLLGCLATAGLITEPARARLAEMQAARTVPGNDEVASSVRMTSHAFTTRDYLASEGVPVDAPANLRIQEREAPVDAFAQEFANKQPSVDLAADVYPQLEALWVALLGADADGVHPEQAMHAWDVLADGCETYLRAPWSEPHDPSGFVRAALLRVSTSDVPAPDPSSDSQFDERQSWSRPSPRLVAAEALMRLAAKSQVADEEVLAAIDRLSRDPVAAVRYQVARALVSLWDTSRPSFWRIAESMAASDPSRGVLNGLVVGGLSAVCPVDPDRSVALATLIYGRTRTGPGSATIGELCFALVGDLWVFRGHQPSKALITEALTNLRGHLDSVQHMIARLRQPLIGGRVSPPEPLVEAIRRRALDLHQSVATTAVVLYQEAVVETPNAPPLSEAESHGLGRLLDSFGWNLYFASGADAERPSSKNEAPSRDVQARLLREAAPLFELLTPVAIPSLTHHLIETLAFLAEHNPPGVFLGIAALVRAGRAAGYQYDSLAEKVAVQLVDQYLGDYRYIFQDDEDLRRALVAVLDTFVGAGSLDARRLVYRLDSIFR
jgi:hypothetical protein